MSVFGKWFPSSSTPIIIKPPPELDIATMSFINSHHSCFDSGSKDDLKSADADSPTSVSASIVIGETCRGATHLPAQRTPRYVGYRPIKADRAYRPLQHSSVAFDSYTCIRRSDLSEHSDKDLPPIDCR